MIRLFKNQTLFQQFALAFIVVIFIPILCISIVSYHNGYTQIKKQHEETYLQMTADMNDKFSAAIKELDWISLQLTNQEQIKSFVRQEPDSYYEKYKLQQWGGSQLLLNNLITDNQYVSRVSVIGDNGMEYSFYGAGVREYDKNLYDHPAVVAKAERYRKELSSDGKVKVFLGNLKEGSADVYLTVARRFSAGAYFRMSGSIFIEIKADMLQKLISGMNLRDGAVWVINEAGDIVYQTDTGNIGKKLSDYFEPELLTEEYGSFTIRRDGSNIFVTYTKNKENGWVSLIEIPVSLMEKPIKDVRMALLYTILVALPLTLCLGFQFIKSILEPIRQLEWHMDRISRQEWEKVSGDIPCNEIGTLMTQYNQMVDQIQELIEKVYKAEIQQSQDRLMRRDAQLQALQTQINPHFLYNTLGAINTYAMEADQTEIEQMVGALGQMFRYAVQNPLEPVRIADEVRHAECYLTIMEYRHRLMPLISWDVDSCLDQQILRLTLQPLLENVFQHAFECGIKEGDYIRIRAKIGASVEVEVLDNGSGMAELEKGRFYHLEEVTGVIFGIGLTNVNKRIQLIYGEEYGVTICKNQEGGTTIRLLLPCIIDRDPDTKHDISY